MKTRGKADPRLGARWGKPDCEGSFEEREREKGEIRAGWNANWDPPFFLFFFLKKNALGWLWL